MQREAKNHASFDNSPPLSLYVCLLATASLTSFFMWGRPLETQAFVLYGTSWWSLGNHNETCVGCIVSCTTATNCSRNWSRSTSLRSVALKAATTLAASYLRR